MCRNFFGSAVALALQKNYSPFATHYSPLAICHSLPFLARQLPRPPILSTDSKSVAKVTKPAKAG